MELMNKEIEQTIFYKDLEKASKQKPHERTSKKGLRYKAGKGENLFKNLKKTEKRLQNRKKEIIKEQNIIDGKLNKLGDVQDPTLRMEKLMSKHENLSAEYQDIIDILERMGVKQPEINY